MTLSVVCIGAGISSLSAAVALRPHVSRIVILEAAVNADQMNVRAAGLALLPCGTHVLQKLGIDPGKDVQAVHMQSILEIEWKDGSLKRETGPLPPTCYTAHRGALLDALVKKATCTDGAGVPAELLLGKQATKVDVESGTVTTEDGSVYEGDLIIGGDGVRSITRKAIVKEAIVQPSGLSVYRWTMNASDWAHLPEEAKIRINELVSPSNNHLNVVDAGEKRIVTYSCHTSGLINGALLVPDYKLPHTTEDWASAGSLAHLHSMVQDLHEPLRSLLGCIPSCGLWQLRKQAPLRTWHKGKAIILGDAAHPMLPFQAVAGCLAMEDAEALQYCLGQVGYRPERVPEALSQTFCMRFIRCSIIQHFSNSSSFGNEFMEKAAKWSLENAARQTEDQESNIVPVTSSGIDDVVQRDIVERVRETAELFDVRAASAWVTGYTLDDFVKNERRYILDEPYV
ncbi:hypothetical protein QQS21_004051 [Conoideocrella luteorostrata]|uniref:FAD-binding domain-containing protein n=1 Tax=Conoideocrella luteorostrata TaxID=1105319 RepID=A0AAJ0CUN1_9HYPO|nr:hypothetical protein QQS21_004051 [Conoideocrella luteorostrata]